MITDLEASIDQSLTTRITSYRKIVINSNECIILFRTPFLCPEHTIPLKIVVYHWFRHWLNIVTSRQLIYDVTRKWGTGIVTSYSSIVLARANILAQRGSSLVNNNREYRFLTTWCSRLIVYENDIRKSNTGGWKILPSISYRFSLKQSKPMT